MSLLVAWLRVGQERTPKETDEETQFRLLQRTLGSNADTWILATCNQIEIMRCDRGNDRRAEVLECYGGLTLWQAAKWVGALDDTDACVKHVVIMRLLGMASTAKAVQCRIPWMRSVERSYLVKLEGVQEKSDANAQFFESC